MLPDFALRGARGGRRTCDAVETCPCGFYSASKVEFEKHCKRKCYDPYSGCTTQLYGGPLKQYLSKYAEDERALRDDSLTECAIGDVDFNELFLANFCLDSEISMARGQELMDFMKIRFPCPGSTGMKTMKTVWRRLKGGTHYPKPMKKLFSMEKTFTDVPHDWSPGKPTVTFRHGNMLNVLTDMLWDTSLVNPKDPDCFVTESCERLNDDGERLLRDLQDGSVWNKLDEELLETFGEGHRHRIFPIMIYLDETHLTQKGTQTAKPIFVSTGVLGSRYRNKDRGWRLLGFLPILRPTQAAKETDQYREFKAALYHECWSSMLEPLREVQRDGGFYLDLPCAPGDDPMEPFIYHPKIFIVSQDSPEGYLLCGQSLSHATARPCRFCWVDHEHCNDGETIGDRRTAAVNYEIAQPAIEALRNGYYGTIGAARELLKLHSLTAVVNGTHGAPVCALLT